MRNINSLQSETFEYQPELESSFGEFEGNFETGAEEFGGSFGEYETPSTQKNLNYFDAWWRAPDGTTTLLKKYRREETEADASRLFDVFCLDQQNATRNRGAGRL